MMKKVKDETGTESMPIPVVTKSPQSNLIIKKDKVSVQEKNSSQNEVQSLIMRAIDNKVDVATMEKLLAMRKELKEEKAKEEFYVAMASFQRDCPTIHKTKSVRTNAGVLAYKYAPIESIVEQVREQLDKYGFSYSTNMELSDAGVTVSVKVTHVAGHSEITKMTVPLGGKTGVMSQSQVVAAAQTFAKRYAFCNAFGILTGDEDTDGAIPEPPIIQRPTCSQDHTKLEVKIVEEGNHAGRKYVKCPACTFFQWIEE